MEKHCVNFLSVKLLTSAEIGELLGIPSEGSRFHPYKLCDWEGFLKRIFMYHFVECLNLKVRLKIRVDNEYLWCKESNYE